ncbi:hypothetical protein [Pleionea mediterranea]|uniref:WD40 repeat protein n=1 Tax=Pleionea mediterranea TaxID=523701 RepID=A0A316GF45_9GAMM|nr:hypothetical protein [Pleionea mediterranea]PWK53307.1 hypothetical protein C8D97_103134 [Pleionea mediterranea]
MLGFKWVVLTVITLCIIASSKLHAVPGTDISLFRILNDGATLSLVFEKTLVQRKGYDNQPAFTEDSSAMVYTRMEQNATDIWLVPLPVNDVLGSEDNNTEAEVKEHKTKVLEQKELDKATRKEVFLQPRAITQTPESEYSATPGLYRAYTDASKTNTPDTNALKTNESGTNKSNREIMFSAVVANDKQQTLWRYNHDKPAEKLSGPITPVGYHAWINQQQLAMFRLSNPHELVLYTLGNDDYDVVAKDIGRCLVSQNNGDEFFFVQNQQRSKAIYSYSLKQGKANKVITLFDDNEDFAYHPEIGLIHSNGSRLFFSLAPYEQWSSLPTRSNTKLTNISRLAISPDAKWLAVVHQDLD